MTIAVIAYAASLIVIAAIAILGRRTVLLQRKVRRELNEVRIARTIREMAPEQESPKPAVSTPPVNNAFGYLPASSQAVSTSPPNSFDAKNGFIG